MKKKHSIMIWFSEIDTGELLKSTPISSLCHVCNGDKKGDAKRFGHDFQGHAMDIEYFQHALGDLWIS